MAREFDYIVVGGGSAGCVVAAGLSEDPSVSVCLVEAGPPDDDPRIRVPLGVVALMGHPRFDWRYESQPLAHLGGRRVAVPRGRTLGGSGAINSMVYIRGRPADYDRWAHLGCTGWDWDSVLPTFVAQETNPRLGGTALHGNGGPLHVDDLPSPHPMIDKLCTAAASVGISRSDDFNGESQEGVGSYQVTMRNARRCSPADAFLKPATGRPNLTVLTNALADRFITRSRRASTLEIVVDGGRERLDVGRELVLAAGSIGSPSILLRSGVGPPRHLRDLGINVELARTGVGANLHDHPAIGIHYGGGDDGYALSLATLPENVLAPWRYLLRGAGLFASNTVEGGGFARTDPGLSEPDVQFHFIPARLGHAGRMITWGRGYYSDVCVLKPRSRGRLQLESSDPAAPPSIDLNLLHDRHDRQTMLRGISLLRRILAHPALTGGKAEELVPGSDVVDAEDVDAFVAARLGTVYHPVGTCRMGAAGDDDTVVDPGLRVVGLENVRVADASVMPEIVAGNTNAPSMMIGGRAVDLLRTSAFA